MSDTPNPDAVLINPQGLSKRFITWSLLCMWAGAFFAGLSGLLALVYLSEFAALTAGHGNMRRTVEAADSFELAEGNFALVWLVGAVTLIVWSAKVHTATTALLRSPTQRKYSWDWAVWVWFIPFANLYSAPKVLVEHQRIADTDRDGHKVVPDWRSTPRRRVLIWWWVLTVSGLILVQVGRGSLTSASSTDSEFLGGLGVAAAGYLIVCVGFGCGAVFMDKVSRRLRAG